MDKFADSRVYGSSNQKSEEQKIFFLVLIASFFVGKGSSKSTSLVRKMQRLSCTANLRTSRATIRDVTDSWCRRRHERH